MRQLELRAQRTVGRTQDTRHSPVFSTARHHGTSMNDCSSRLQPLWPATHAQVWMDLVSWLCVWCCSVHTYSCTYTVFTVVCVRFPAAVRPCSQCILDLKRTSSYYAVLLFVAVLVVAVPRPMQGLFLPTGSILPENEEINEEESAAHLHTASICVAPVAAFACRANKHHGCPCHRRRQLQVGPGARRL